MNHIYKNCEDKNTQCNATKLYEAHLELERKTNKQEQERTEIK